MDNVDIEKLERLCALIENVNDQRTYDALLKLLEVKCLMMRSYEHPEVTD